MRVTQESNITSHRKIQCLNCGIQGPEVEFYPEKGNRVNTRSIAAHASDIETESLMHVGMHSDLHAINRSKLMRMVIW